ncbi:MAG TPA: sodium:proton antiporter NhaD [Cyclobacteriaceae bacterium]|nr:sodium:proton antiporter NhaD [Cyclobacteriaceae bacterium]
MYILIIIVFMLGYIGIALEHKLKVNKTAIAIVTGIVCWTLLMFAPDGKLLESADYSKFLRIEEIEKGAEHHTVISPDELHKEYVLFSLEEHLGEIAQILFFLMGAMTIVELVDAHKGFRLITDKIKTTDLRKLLWMVSWIAFFLSSVLDNLTTTIVMVSLARKLVGERNTRLLFVSMIIIAANAGGAWTPIGDVTTTMLWIGGQITTLNIMKMLLLPSLACMLVPLILVSFALKNHQPTIKSATDNELKEGHAKLMLVLGIGALVSVPIFKTFTHMPPYSGMLLGLGLLWIVSELLSPELDESTKKHYTVAGALSRIDVPSVLFFLGILLAVGALESMQTLHSFAALLDKTFGDQRIIITLIGLISAVVDNVPLVAASMGMYDLTVFPTDNMIWEYLAYCAGTGGSILIIGSAAGVAAMGMEKIDFIWYLKRISLLAMAGYFAGAFVYLLIR